MDEVLCMVGLSQNSLNFLSEILSQIKALHSAINKDTKELQNRQPEQESISKGAPSRNRFCHHLDQNHSLSVTLPNVLTS